MKSRFSQIFGRTLLVCAWLGVGNQLAWADPPTEPKAAKADTKSSDDKTTTGLTRPDFAEDGGPSTGWHFNWHGYARMALRTNGGLVDVRTPYLVDDHYYLSGFAYTRNNETEWAEIFLSAEKEQTRFVVGLFSSQFSDWSETTLQGQRGIATAFVEHSFLPTSIVDVRLRAGMFWDRNGYIEPYDTYIFARAHVAGLSLKTRWMDRVYLNLGYGAHADVINSNQGFTPMAWANLGLDIGWLDVGGYYISTWTRDSEREFSIVEDGDLTVYGVDVRARIPRFGQMYAAVAKYSADQVVFLANAMELLHSTGGRGLTDNFFGPDSENGTGEILVGAWDIRWELSSTLEPWRHKAWARALEGLNLRLFGMYAWVLSEQQSDDPRVNRHDRMYLKWGADILYRPLNTWMKWAFVGLRYDRVILDMDHESMSFRVVTPRVGITFTDGIDIFVSYSRYFYGDQVRLRPNQIPGDLSVTEPGEQVLKLQAQVSW